MFFTIFEYIKEKKDKEKEPKKEIEKPIKKPKKQKENSKKKETKGFSIFKKNKEKKKRKIKYKKPKYISLNINHEHYSAIYLLILYSLVIIIGINLLTIIFSKGNKIEGTIKIENNNKYFYTKYDTINLTDYPEYRNLEENQKIYLIYNRKQKTYEYSLKKKIFGFCLKGNIEKITDYKIEISFDFNNKIPDKYGLEVDYKTYKVRLKSFLGKYYISSDIIEKTKDDIKDSMENLPF